MNNEEYTGKPTRRDSYRKKKKEREKLLYKTRKSIFVFELEITFFFFQLFVPFRVIFFCIFSLFRYRRHRVLMNFIAGSLGRAIDTRNLRIEGNFLAEKFWYLHLRLVIGYEWDEFSVSWTNRWIRKGRTNVV